MSFISDDINRVSRGFGGGGGSSFDLFDTIGNFGNIAGNIAGGQAAGRKDQGDFNLRAATAGTAAEQSQKALSSRLFSDALHRAILGGALQGTKDAKITGAPVAVPHVSGGLRPSGIVGSAPGTTPQAIGKLAQERGLADMMSNGQYSMPFDFHHLAPPASGGSKAMSILGTIGSFLPFL